MAYTKIHAIKSTVGKAINYICNPEKTILKDGTQLVSSFGCAVETADLEFSLTKNMAKQFNGDYTKTGGAENLAYHIVQSFSIEDGDRVSAEEIHQLGKDFAEKYFKGSYEYVLATHIDKKHIHNHIIFNATSFETNTKFYSRPFKTVKEIREVSDKVCEEKGLTIINNKSAIKCESKTYQQWKSERTEYISWRKSIKERIDRAISYADNYDEFKKLMEKENCVLKEGKHLYIKCNDGQKNYMKGKTIGYNYTREKIIERIESGKERVDEKTLNKEDIKAVINKEKADISISDYMKARRKYQHDKLHSLANAMSISRKFEVMNFADFDTKIDELEWYQNIETRSYQSSLSDLQKEKKTLQLVVDYKKALDIKKQADSLKFRPIAKRKFEYQHKQELENLPKIEEALAKLKVNISNIDVDKCLKRLQLTNAQLVQIKEVLYLNGKDIELLKNAKEIISKFIDTDREEILPKEKEEVQEQDENKLLNYYYNLYLKQQKKKNRDLDL